MALTKESVDVGIVVRDIDKMLPFYRDVLELEYVGATPSAALGGALHRLLAGTSAIKLVELGSPSPESNPPGGIAGGTGFRYLTLSVDDIEATLARCSAAGATVVWEKRPLGARPGFVGMVEDPEGNWVEFIEIPSEA